MKIYISSEPDRIRYQTESFETATNDQIARVVCVLEQLKLELLTFLEEDFRIVEEIEDGWANKKL